MKARSPQRSKSGFSLMEMLMTVGILGIITGIAIPLLSSSNGYEVARNRRNAQEFTAVSGTAQAAGLNLVVPGDLASTIRNIMAGGTPANGAFKGQSFRATGVSEADAMKAMDYLQIRDGSLIYKAGAL